MVGYGDEMGVEWTDEEYVNGDLGNSAAGCSVKATGMKSALPQPGVLRTWWADVTQMRGSDWDRLEDTQGVHGSAAYMQSDSDHLESLEAEKQTLKARLVVA
jgi:hypothetical protein